MSVYTKNWTHVNFLDSLWLKANPCGWWWWMTVHLDTHERSILNNQYQNMCGKRLFQLRGVDWEVVQYVILCNSLAQVSLYFCVYTWPMFLQKVEYFMTFLQLWTVCISSRACVCVMSADLSAANTIMMKLRCGVPMIHVNFVSFSACVCGRRGIKRSRRHTDGSRMWGAGNSCVPL